MFSALMLFAAWQAVAPTINPVHSHFYKLDEGFVLSISPDPKEPKLGEAKSIATSTYPVCSNPCKGGTKHTLHADCNTSCDGPCLERHTYTFVPTHEIPDKDKDVDAFFDIRDKVNAAISKANGGNEPKVKPSMFKDMLDDALGDEKHQFDVKVKWQHWCKKPCSEQHRIPLYWRFPVVVDWDFGKEIINADGQKETRSIKKGKFTFYLDFPSKEYKDDDPHVECKCTAVKPEDDSLPLDETAYIYEDGPKPTKLSASDLDKFGVEVVCDNMNEGTVTAVNYQPMPVDLVVQPGTMLVCDDDADQDCVIVRGCRLHLMAADYWASLWGGQPAVSVSAPIRLQCINMHKHEPNSKVKYHVRLPGSEALRRLAVFQSKQMIGGPWDQARTWIYTDHATLDDISKVDLLGPSEGGYLKAAWQLSTIEPFLDWSDSDFRPCLEPRLIAGNSSGREATAWFVSEMAELDPKGLADWVDGHGAAFAPLWTDVSLAVNAKHLADVVSALIGSSEPTIRTCGIRFALKTVPIEKRSLVSQNGGLEGLNQALSSAKEEGEAAALLDVAEAYGSKAAWYGLSNISSKLPAARARAEKILASLGR